MQFHVYGRSGEAAAGTVRMSSGERKVERSYIRAATGRMANTAGIELEDAGIELEAHGYIRLNGRPETTAPGVWAIGESASSPQFTHV